MSDDILVFQEDTLLQVEEQLDGDFILFNVTELAAPVVVPTPGDVLVFTESSSTDVRTQYSSGAVFVLSSGGPPGPAGPPGPQQIYDSPTPPVSPVLPYLRVERDVDGDIQAIYIGTET